MAFPFFLVHINTVLYYVYNMNDVCVINEICVLISMFPYSRRVRVSTFSLPAVFLFFYFKGACAVNETWRQVLRCCGNRREGRQQCDASEDYRFVCVCVCVEYFVHGAFSCANQK